MEIDVTDELVRNVARLARLGLTPESERELKTHFEKVLAYVESLDGLDVSGVEASHFTPDTFNAVRADEKRDSLPTEIGLQNAPSAREQSFVVPRIVAGGGGA